MNIRRDLYGKKGQENETEEIFDVSNTPKMEESISVREDGNGFVIGTQIDLENLTKSNLTGGPIRGEKSNDDSSKSNAADKSGTTENSKVEELVENIRHNMLDGNI